MMFVLLFLAIYGGVALIYLITGITSGQMRAIPLSLTIGQASRQGRRFWYWAYATFNTFIAAFCAALIAVLILGSSRPS